MKKVDQDEKAITLVALVVTIIVLLILAGVALTFTLGNNGIINRSKDAVQKHNQAVSNEEEGMNEISRVLEEMTNGDNQQPDELYKDIDLTIYVGRLNRQRADYLRMNLLLEELGSDGTTPTGATLTYHIGIDGYAEKNSDTNYAFKSSTFQVEMLQDETAQYYNAFYGNFNTIHVTGKVKKDKKYTIKVNTQGIILSTGDSTVSKREISMYTGSLAIDKTQLKESALAWHYDLDNSGGTGDFDKTVMSVFRTRLANGEYSNLPPKTSNGQKYVVLMDGKGNLKKEVEEFLGADLNRDGLIDDKDTNLLVDGASSMF